MKEVDEDFADTLKTKTKAAAWFAHNCDPKERNEFVKNLQAALKRHDLSLDVYGDCGPFKCPRTEQEKCNSMIKRDYYFYMALENSFHEDFVSEKVLHGLLNNAIPIVFGGANYSRFLPPLSYINAKKYTIKELAALMNNLIESPYLYRQYFRWRNHYEFISTMPEDQSGNKRMFNFTKYEGEGVCNFCAALHDKKKMETSTVYENIRSWWSPDYAEKC
ncbi:glycosyltransferase family 10 (fucosyltransferase) c-term domain-containing protein [Phthorimaea operculella]|nr:glycosyltransferase family 10 (fucosyltransferase) c-term domain-containing protein [Phthorimaea operculella]